MNMYIRRLFFGICVIVYQTTVVSKSYAANRCIDYFGNEGTCKPYFLCRGSHRPSARPPPLCRWSSKGPIVCCSRKRGTTTIAPPSPQPGEKAKYWCNKYTQLCPPIVHITGGEPAKTDEFPHMAAVGYGSKDNPKWRCGGSLISKNFVLTAAHCLYSPELGQANWVHLGAENLYNSVHGETYPIIKRIKHPEYNPGIKYNDVALLKIGDSLEFHTLPIFSKHLHPLCLPSLDKRVLYTKAIATGWGMTSFGGDSSPDLLKVELNILNATKCNETYDLQIRIGNSLKRGIDSTMLCAGYLCGGKDTCQGDSGGPLQVPIRHTCLYKIYGITAFGSFCGCENTPAVYMKVSEYVPWIENIVWP